MSWSPCPDPVLGDRAVADAIETLIVPRAVDLGEMTGPPRPALQPSARWSARSSSSTRWGRRSS